MHSSRPTQHRENKGDVMKITRTVLMEKARAMGLKGLSKKRKHELIHAIQLAEGNRDCFGRIPDCGIEDCMFREECI